MHQIRLGVDWDGTVWQHITQWAELLGDTSYTYATCTTWEHPIDWAGGMDAFSALLKRSEQPEVMMAGWGRFMFAGAISVLQELQQAGVHLTLLTARPDHSLPILLTILARHDLAPDLTISQGSADKVGYCLQNGISLLIEDHPSTIRAAHAA